MELILSYGVKIRSGCSYMDGMLENTRRQYTGAVRFFCGVCQNEWPLISGMNSKETVNALEPLTHRTKGHPEPKYDFDGEFPNFPSYLRRGAIACARGMVSAYHSLLRNWEESGKAGKEPGFPDITGEGPSLYFKNMFVFTDRDGSPLPKGELSVYAKVKVYCSQRQLLQDKPLPDGVKKQIAKGKADPEKYVWDWLSIKLKPSDVRYLQKMQDSGREVLCPVLVSLGKRHLLRFATKKIQPLTDKAVWEQKILAVDLGINTPATCCVMLPDGTVLARRFFKDAADKGLLEHRLGRISRAQSHGSRKTPVLWRMADNANRKLSDKTADFIISLAEEFDVDVIVFEHLSLGGRKRGSKKKSLHHWRAKYVQQLVGNRAHARGMRVATICAWGTSKLAFDGSGAVERGIGNNYSICRFTNGKIYNCDLSASYNIGARYFIREIRKSMAVKPWSELTAKVPELEKRTTCTLSSLIKLNAELSPSGDEKPEDCAKSAA